MPWNNKYRRLDEGEIRFHPMTPDPKDAVIDELVKVLTENERAWTEMLDRDFLHWSNISGATKLRDDSRAALATASKLKDEP